MSKGEEQLRRLIEENPGLPMLVLAPSTPSDYDSYYHDVCSASVKSMLFPNEVAEMYGDFYGLDCDRYYDDVDDVSERIEDYWLHDGEHGKDLFYSSIVWHTTYMQIADMMAEDMPWHKYIVIECF